MGRILNAILHCVIGKVGVALQIFRLFHVKKQQQWRSRARQQAPILQGGDDALKEYFSEKKRTKKGIKTSTEPQLMQEGKQAFMLQCCFLIWNQQPTCNFQDFHNYATLSSRLGMIFLCLDNAIFALIITMMWKIFYARGFWEIRQPPALDISKWLPWPYAISIKGGVQ